MYKNSLKTKERRNNNSLDQELDKVIETLDTLDLELNKSNRPLDYPVRKTEIEGFNKNNEITVKSKEEKANFM